MPLVLGLTCEPPDNLVHLTTKDGRHICTIEYVEYRGGKIRLGFRADKEEVVIQRERVRLAIEKEKAKAVDGA